MSVRTLDWSSSDDSDDYSYSLDSSDISTDELFLNDSMVSYDFTGVSTVERVIGNVPEPIQKIYDFDDYLDDEGKPVIEDLIEHLRGEGRIDETVLLEIIAAAKTIFANEDNIVVLDSPVTICGDLHGQFFDLLKILTLGGEPGEQNYLFLGDYVDRGNFSVEILILLYSYKIKFPSNFFMLRGNHECRHLSEYFSFKEECVYKYSETIYEAFTTSFDSLPLAALVDDSLFCVHGGLSPKIKSLENVMEIQRFRETPSFGPMCDIMWSDPCEDFYSESEFDFATNLARGCSYVYSFDAVRKFLRDNKLLTLIRAHEVQDEGYHINRMNPDTGFPSMITIFSAANYCGTYGNRGGIIKFRGREMNIRQFNATHKEPYYLPGFQNAFEWSFPFLAEKVGDVLLCILNLVDDNETSVDTEKISIRIKAIGRVLSQFKTIREQRSVELKLKGLASPAIHIEDITTTLETIRSYEGSRILDNENEKRPPNVDRYSRKYFSTGAIKLFTGSFEYDIRKSGTHPPSRSNPSIKVRKRKKSKKRRMQFVNRVNPESQSDTIY